MSSILPALLRMIVRRKPKEIEVERWGGPGEYVIPEEHLLHKGSRLVVQPGDYIAKPTAQDWYPLAAVALQRDFEFVRGLEPNAADDEHTGPRCSAEDCGERGAGVKRLGTSGLLGVFACVKHETAIRKALAAERRSRSFTEMG